MKSNDETWVGLMAEAHNAIYEEFVTPDAIISALREQYGNEIAEKHYRTMHRQARALIRLVSALAVIRSYVPSLWFERMIHFAKSKKNLSETEMKKLIEEEKRRQEQEERHLALNLFP